MELEKFQILYINLQCEFEFLLDYQNIFRI